MTWGTVDPPPKPVTPIRISDLKPGQQWIAKVRGGGVAKIQIGKEIYQRTVSIAFLGPYRYPTSFFLCLFDDIEWIEEVAG